MFSPIRIDLDGVDRIFRRHICHIGQDHLIREFSVGGDVLTHHYPMPAFADDSREWLEADGVGGFASGTVGLVRTRRYHALLLAATTPPTGRVVLVNGFDAWLETPGRRVALSSQHYEPDVIHPDGSSRIEAFEREPWPRWTFRVDADTVVQHGIFVAHGRPRAIVSWRLVRQSDSSSFARLIVRPFLSGRDYHGMHHENLNCHTDTRHEANRVIWRPYDGLPAIVSRSNGAYEHQPDWYRRFRYAAETGRGLDDTEDLLSPGWLSWDLTAGEAVWVLDSGDSQPDGDDEVLELVDRARRSERARRASFQGPVERSADAYIVKRGQGHTIVAGYPWFTDWGRDTFIAMRGVCLATGRFDDARSILLEWSGDVSEGMLPNRFPDGGDVPEYNAVDASLWFIVAVRDLLDAADRDQASVSAHERVRLLEAVSQILEGYTHGTRFGIRADPDGLLACGVPGVQLTWMDAKVGDFVVTPRIGKPVEVQALWLASLAFASHVDARWQMVYDRAQLSFGERFWNPDRQCLYDVVDVDHQPGHVDAAIRPNQILAIGGLGVTLIDRAHARQVVDLVEAELLTPIGLRSLARSEPAYVGHYAGGPGERDRAYHQGTVWPWLIGPFVEAWLAVRDQTPEIKREARDRFVAPLLSHLDEAGLGHVSEIADGDAPFTPRGCPFQAWSIGELLRVVALLDEPMARRSP